MFGIRRYGVKILNENGKGLASDGGLGYMFATGYELTKHIRVGLYSLGAWKKLEFRNWDRIGRNHLSFLVTAVLY